MSGAAPPLRFLGVVVGGWVCARAAVLAPDWLTEEVQASEAPLPRQTLAKAPASAPIAMGASAPVPASIERAAPAVQKDRSPELALSFDSGQLAVVAAAPVASAMPNVEQPRAVASADLMPVQPVAAVLAAEPGRLNVSGWAIVREGANSQLATGGVLGGSQAGMRATYRMTRSLALSGRVSSPLEGDGAEAAVGLEWQPSRKVPIRLLAERRQAIGDEGRSAFALLAHGGVSDVRVAGPVTADAYAQAGIVGARERDLFTDGAVKLHVPIDERVTVGVGAWGAAQPGIERLDVGPQVTVALPGGPATLKVSAEWRVRVAGDAQPGSGPALTLSTDF